ncbi:Polymorphic membrane protein F,chlamydial polymorphic outer membrane protein repeat,Autotransporter beta-domain [Chlamydia poikilotherma]|uniref:Polymorphic membrane protein F,chlamydial polymorphic outer membrane protein repeat,Autotransporter beta-domain n=1 Tax=Chlamydia poikilotherma TaxID=1967783 RepID=A0A3B0QFL9_9CHLA|nr:polymorphic outer membrane protein middle domain-containing protein [Chlamydia poikilotherma]SYX08774.1 Polymorphic membrane protein F,chlamydial polymorphic outer membrane protein repeat,Autotransporter beta-domain [Chlamydia poikilotherma]
MRPSLYKILISSTLTIPLSFHFSQLHAEVALTQESILDANGAFSPQSTSTAGGTTYNVEEDISIVDAGQTAALASAAFVQTADNLTFKGNGHSLSIENVNSGANPGGINVSTADKVLTLTDFSKLSFTKCPEATVNTGKGAVNSGGALNLANNASILFDQNHSAEDGGAISCKAFSLTGSSKEISFTTNTSAKKGGAIAAKGVTNISDNQGNIVFSGNTAINSGGAVYTEGNTTIAENSSVVFNNNAVTGTGDGCGGAIHCSKTGSSPTLTIRDNKVLIFKENTSAAKGGAIYADKLYLTSGGPTLFTSNKATHATPKGGAIGIAANGECSITAEHGDITFENNLAATANNATVKRNAINIEGNGKFVNLRAASGKTITFYDPVVVEGAAADLLTLNKAEGDKVYNGRIIFSGEKHTEAEAAVADNLKTIFTQPITLAAGELILRNGVEVEAKTVLQTAGSQILMDTGTKLSAKTEDVTLTNLAINPNSLDGTNLAVVAAVANTKNVTLSGAIGVIDPTGKFYEDHKLNETLSLQGIQLSAKGAVTTTNVPSATVGVPEHHYGYQGNWSVAWVKDATSDPKTQTAVFKWTKTGYIPNPERRAPLVLNSLWGSFMDVRSIQDVVERSVDSILETRRGLWVSGVGNFFHKDQSAANRKFRHISSGYVLGATTNTSKEDTLSVAFCQLFGKDKDYLVAQNAANIYAGSIYYQHVSKFDDLTRLFNGPNTCCSGFSKEIPIFLDAQVTYCHSGNTMTTTYTDYPEVKGSWGNDTVGVALSTSVPIPIFSSSFFDSYAPFAKLQVVYAHQEDFKEPTREGRTFESSDLLNVSVPIGIKFEKLVYGERTAYDLTLMYVPDVYRHNPSCMTGLAINDVTWLTTATNLARQAFIVRAGNHIALTSGFEMFSQFGFELRSSSRNYNVDLGAKVSF